MDINEIINFIPYLTKDQLYQLLSKATNAIERVEEAEAERKRRESVRQRQREIVDEMNRCLREFHTLSVSLHDINVGDYMESYTNCFVDGEYESPVFGFTIDQDNDICVSTSPYDINAEWYRKEKEELAKRKRG